MNTTPLISNPEPPEGEVYTVVGGERIDRDKKGLSGLSIALLNRGSRPFRRDFFEELCRLGALEVISVESSPCPHDVEVLSRRYGQLRFLIFPESVNTGIKIDAAVREAVGDHVFVLWGDMQINTSGISSRVFAKVSEKERLCTVPSFRDNAGDPLPTLLGPLPGPGGSFDVRPYSAVSGESATLAPWDFAGIYRKDKHLALGGFDHRITESWWQKIDYGMRAWLWGEELRVHPSLKVGYIEEPPSEDASVGPGYRRFFFRNLAVRRLGDAGILPRSSWRSYRRSSGESAASAKQDWKDARFWVHENRYRFKRDAASLAETWEWEG